MNMEVLDTANDVARRAADEVARVVAHGEDARIVLPAGATPVPMYAELVRRCRSSEVNLSAAHFFQLDELAGVGQEDPRSFSAFLKEHLLDAIDRCEGRDHLLDGASASTIEEVRRHGAVLTELGGADLVLLGLGTNGHVAFNEPGSSLDDGARVVELHDATVRSFGPSFGKDGPPRLGLTLGLREIVAGRRLVLMVTGPSKAPTLKRLLREPPDPSCPASLVLSHHPSILILADRQAAEG